ncbi:MAG: hypothetical protein M3Q71_07890 [Chloroflexota bacterium]|nr:hypothetical protein [Chloroflexota bacterium]
MTQRDAIRSTFTVIRGGKADRPPAPAWLGSMTVQDPETGEVAGGRVAVTPRPDGTYLVRPVRSGPQAWQDH